MAENNDVEIDPTTCEEFFTSDDSPLVGLLRDLMEQMVSLTRAKAPVMDPKQVWSHKSSGFQNASGIKGPGYTKRNITGKIGHVKQNDFLFAGADAPGDPTFFLEAPSEQMHSRNPFLTSTLDEIQLD